MTHTQVLLGVMTIHLLALLSPGPNSLIVTQVAASQNRRAGVATALGIAAGAAVWATGATIGLSAVFDRHPWLYDGLRVIGGAYLTYLGVGLCRAGSNPSQSPPGARSHSKAFMLGVRTILANPKAVVFSASVLAPALTPEIPARVKAAAIGIIVLNSACWHVALAWFFSTRDARRVYRGASQTVNRVAGVILTALGIALAGQGMRR